MTVKLFVYARNPNVPQKALSERSQGYVIGGKLKRSCISIQ